MGHGDADEDMYIVAICREMKWTYQTYRQQPIQFIAGIAARMSAERKVEKHLERKHGNLSNPRNSH